MHVLALPDDVLGLIAARLDPRAFCALRRTCCELARLSFADYACAQLALARGRSRPVAAAIAGAVLGRAVCVFKTTEGRRVLDFAASLDNVLVDLAAKKAGRHGVLEVLDWLQAGVNAPALASAARTAAAHGHLAACRQCIGVLRGSGDFSYICAVAAAAATAHNQISVLDWLLTVLPSVAASPKVVNAAARHGSIAVLDRLYSLRGRQIPDAIEDTVLSELARVGAVDKLAWLAGHGLDQMICRRLRSLSAEAVSCNQLGVLKILETIVGQPGLFDGRDERARLLDAAAAHGSCAALTALVASADHASEPADALFAGATAMFTGAALTFAGAGVLDLSEPSCSKNFQFGLDEKTRLRLARAAACNSRTNVLDWLLARGLDRHEFAVSSLKTTALGGRVGVLAWAVRCFGFTAEDFALYAGRHEATDAFLAELFPRAGRT